MITELDAGTIANLPGWDYPLPASQVHEILEQACTPGIYRVSLADRHGRARLRARHGAIGDARRLGEPRDMVEVSAPVVLRGETVAVVRVAGAPDESTALEDAARLTAARLGDAWAAAQEIDSLAGEIVHAYEELHLLYELGEALTGQFTVAQAAELVLDKIRHALHAAWAELRLNDDERWADIGWRALEGRVAEPVVQFTQDVFDLRKCKIFDSAGMVRDAEPEECIGIERAAVWNGSP